MLDERNIYRKTPKGAEVVVNRTLRLSVRQRTLLIQVDGQTPTHALIERMQALGDVREDLLALFNAGLIEAHGTSSLTPRAASKPAPAPLARPAASPAPLVSPAPPRPVPPAPAALPLPVATAPQGATLKRRSLAIARLHLLEIMERTLGPNSGPARELIRQCATREALLEALAECVQIMRELADDERARVIEQQVLNLLPEASN